MKRLEFHAMGSRMLAVIDSDDPASGRALARVPAWFEEWEQSLSRFRADSELSRLNRSGGGAVVVSKTLWQVFETALQAESGSGGLVRPTVLDALVQAGYDRSFEQLSNGGSSLPESPLESPCLAGMRRDTATRTLHLPEGIHLDFGGVAKGWAAAKALGRLRRFGPALVDAGGDIAVSGPSRDGSAWPIGVADPFNPGVHFETLLIKRGGVATSGIDYHRWQMGGQWSHHIIDPASSRPAETDLLAVTTVAPDVVQAEMAAKTVLISGSGAGMDWLEADPTLAGILILQTGDRRYSRHMSDFLWRAVL